MKWRTTSMLLAILLLGLLGAGTAQAASGTKYIRDDATGGDCTSIGKWDLANKTCTLKMDLTGSIVIGDKGGAGITLDGHGHKLTSSGSVVGVTMSAPGYYLGPSTIKNLKINGFGVGIWVDIDLFATIIDNTISKNGTGLSLQRSYGPVDHNQILNNQVGINTTHGQHTFSNNTISNNTLAVSTEDIGPEGAVITNNLFMKNATLFRFWDDDGTVIYNNNFIDNDHPLEANSGAWGGVFSRPAPTGGNYWSNYHTRAQGCKDLNNDDFCDTPFVLRVSCSIPTTGCAIQDNLPWAKRNGWLHKK
ncbi:MAG: right-handed parallel beta-helix repeat-containing protein [Chloroflexi bacterium]|nr:right-handed parallel beta-helix repeat-containing protein [Chloroflexota bacterium]